MTLASAQLQLVRSASASPAAQRYYDDFCACGCGGRIEIKPSHRRDGRPRFIRGHKSRQSVARAWAEGERGKHVCGCGCGQAIRVLPEHFWRGVPRYLNHHAQRVAVPFPLTPWNKGMGVNAKIQWRERKFTFADKVRILMRCGFRCVECGHDRIEDLQFDHVVPVWEGGAATPDNGQALCRNCHARKTKQDNARAQRALRARAREASGQADLFGHNGEVVPCR